MREQREGRIAGEREAGERGGRERERESKEEVQE